MLNNHINNPCWCLGTCTTPITPVCSKGHCIRLGNILVRPEDSVGPCGKVGRVDFKCFDLTGCCGQEFNGVVIHNTNPEKLTVNSITKDYLEFTTTSEANPLDKITLTIKISCCSLADYAQITIFIKDLCDCITCPTGFTCNKCDKECIAIQEIGELILTQDPEYIAITDSGIKLN